MSPLPRRETLTVEFKSDRKCLPDRDLIEAVVCMANAQGGDIYLGVEDDGQPTGLHPQHRLLEGLAALVANRTQPPVHVVVTELDVDGVTVARISVPASPQPVASNEGVTKRRRLQANGEPECVPYLPHEFPARQAHFGLLDVSAQAVASATLDDLDPVERARLRQFILRHNGDQALLELDDEQLDGVLGLTVRAGTVRQPTLTGLLLIGQEAALRRLVPTHEIAFQILEGEEVRHNDFRREPLLRALEWLETAFRPLNTEREFQAGLFRVAIPRLDARTFREAVANAVTHRDYTVRGAVYVRLTGQDMTISNPGGLVEGVTLGNLLTTEPRPRNPALADALKRIGLVERTGRGVDLIYRGQLRYGRHNPDYTASTPHAVVLRLSLAEANEVLAILREQRRATADQLAQWLHKDASRIGASVEPLVEAGLLQAHGTGRGRSYTLAASVYRQLGQQAQYTRQAGFDRLHQVQMIQSFVRQHGRITRQEVMELCRLSPDQAYKTLKRMCEEKILLKQGDRKAVVYFKA